MQAFAAAHFHPCPGVAGHGVVEYAVHIEENGFCYVGEVV